MRYGAIVCAAVFAALASVASTQPVLAQASTPVLVELFTSEGCSSCPPADALLKQLQGTETDEHRIVVLSEHVTYWNQLGWSDPFSQQLFTDRQEGYGHRFSLDSVYTPQVVVNGSRQELGSDRAAILRAVQEQPAATDLQVHVLSAKREGDRIAFTYTVMGKGRSAGLFAVVSDDAATSDVPRGENSGRRLMHVAVARSLTHLGSARADAQVQEGSVMAPAAAKSAEHLVLFAQEG